MPEPPQKKPDPLGSLLVIGSAVGFGLMALFRGWAVAGGSENATLLTIRFTAAGLILGVAMLLRGTAAPRGRLLACLLAMGAVGYFGEAFCYFEALGRLPSGLVAALLYLYPALVAVLARIFLKERLTPLKLGTMAAAVFGAVLTVGPLDGLGPSNHGAAVGVAFGLGCAACYAGYIVAGSRVTRDADPVACSTVVCLSCAAVMLGVALARGWTPPRSALGWAGIAGLTLFSTVGSVMMFLAGLKRVGPVRASTFSTLEAVTTLLVGRFALGERLSAWQWAGAAIILLAAAAAARAGADPGAGQHPLTKSSEKKS